MSMQDRRAGVQAPRPVAMRPRVAGMRLTLSLGFSSLAVWALGPLVKASGFANLLMLMAAISLCSAAALLAMPGERLAAVPQPA